MKRLVCLVLTTWMVAGVGFAGDESNLEGAWEFVSGTFTTPDSSTEVTASERTMLKILTPTHFSVVYRTPDGTFAHAGRYSVKGETYTEHIELATGADIVGQSYTFDSKLDGDTWQISGKMANFNLELKETWRRVK